MNENINLVEILKDCSEGTKLYSPLFGEVTLKKLNYAEPYYQIIINTDNSSEKFTIFGQYLNIKESECLLFPSKDQRDWSKFKCPKPKFDPKTLQPFDKVLVRSEKWHSWGCELFSYMSKNADYPCVAIRISYPYCIPYNNETKHLVGTTEEAPEYYRYWEK